MKNLLPTLTIAVAIILGTWILGNSYLKSKRTPSQISVTGLSSSDFNSDLIVWSASFSRRAVNLQEAFNSLKTDQERIKKYIVTKGISANEVVFSAVEIEKEYETQRYPDGSEITTFARYKLSQKVNIESKNVNLVELVSREVTELIN